MTILSSAHTSKYVKMAAEKFVHALKNKDTWNERLTLHEVYVHKAELPNFPAEGQTTPHKLRNSGLAPHPFDLPIENECCTDPRRPTRGKLKPSDNGSCEPETVT